MGVDEPWRDGASLEVVGTGAKPSRLRGELSLVAYGDDFSVRDQYRVGGGSGGVAGPDAAAVEKDSLGREVVLHRRVGGGGRAAQGEEDRREEKT